MAADDRSLVLKYSDDFDRFLKIAVVGRKDIGDILDIADLRDRNSYYRFLFNKIIFPYNAGLEDKLVESEFSEKYLEGLYVLVTNVNPHLEISNLVVGVNNGDTGLIEDEELQKNSLYVPRVRMKPLRVKGKLNKDILRDFEQCLQREVFGQPQIVEPLCLTIEEMLQNATEDNKPIGSYLLLGPTGVGKTETAKAVAGLIFNGSLLTVNCSEFALPHEYAKLIGAPPGYIGHNEGGYLTEGIKNNPRSVVLFDEIEKSHVKTRNILLQLLDEGYVIDSKGFAVDFTKALIIMTSNVGARDWEKYGRGRFLGFRGSSKDDNFKGRERIFRESLDKTFSPEFRNRIDHVITYNELNLETSAKVAEKMMRRSIEPFAKRNVNVRWAKMVPGIIAQLSEFEKYGGRSMGRTAKRLIKRPVLEMMTSGVISDGDTVNIKFDKKTENWAYERAYSKFYQNEEERD